jgi:hypothetical protein
LTFGQKFMAARERIIQDLIKMNIKIISKNLDGIVFISRHTDFSSICQTTDVPHIIFENALGGGLAPSSQTVGS